MAVAAEPSVSVAALRAVGLALGLPTPEALPQLEQELPEVPLGERAAALGRKASTSQLLMAEAAAAVASILRRLAACRDTKNMAAADRVARLGADALLARRKLVATPSRPSVTTPTMSSAVLVAPQAATGTQVWPGALMALQSLAVVVAPAGAQSLLPRQLLVTEARAA